MPVFHTDAAVPGVLFEVFLSKRIEYQAKLYEALQNGLVPHTVREFLLARAPEASHAESERLLRLIPESARPHFRRERIARMQQVCFGFSLTEVDGVFVMDANDPGAHRTQERTQVIQLFFKPDQWVRHVNGDTRLADGHRQALWEWASRLWSEPWTLGSAWQHSDGTDACDEYRLQVAHWALDVQFFVFGFLVGKITEELAMDETEIWVTSSARLVNVVRRVAPA